MRRGIAHSMFYGWLLMASCGYAQVAPVQSLHWQRVPATISAAPVVPVSGVRSLPVSPSMMVQPAISWRPVSPSMMAPVQLMSNGQMIQPGYGATTSRMVMWQPVLPGAGMIQPVGHWQAASPSVIPTTAPAATSWQPAVYLQPASAANVVPRLGSQAINSSPVLGNTLSSNRSFASPVDYYSTRNIPVARYRPIVSLGSVPEGYQVGQGMLGQPKVYVPGQPLRNFVRYLTP